MLPTFVRILLVATTTTLSAACGCDADLRVRYTPHERSLAVGEAFTPSVQFLGCGGTEPLDDAVTWAAADTTILRVDAATGRTTGLRPGRSLVLATGAQYRQVGGIRVTVRTP